MMQDKQRYVETPQVYGVASIPDSIIEMLQSIEARGGSEGFTKNPELFEDVSTQVHAAQTDEEWYSELLKVSKASDQEQFVKELAFVEKRASLHEDPAIRGLAPHFKTLASDPNHEDSLKIIHETMQAVSDTRKTGQAGRNRVLSILRGIEQLGGSEGYKQYIETAPTREVQARLDSTPAGDIFDDGSWEDDWARFRTAAAVLIVLIYVYGDGIEAHGLAWGPGLGLGTTWGWLHRAPASSLVGNTTSVKIESGALVNSQLGAYFKGDDGLMATFVGTLGLGLQLLVGLAGSVYWIRS